MASYYDVHEETGPSLLTALPVVLWQRRWLIILPAILITIIGTAIAFLLPPMYESSGTVLIESQQLPVEGSQETLGDMVDQRIARAKERVLSRQVLIQLIRSNGLYPKQQEEGQAFSTIVDTMRDSAAISGVASDAGGMAAFMGGKRTIALRIGFSYPDPIKAQAIAQQLVNRFLEVDASAQREQASGAANFLGEQEGSIRQEVNDIEDKIQKIKQENGSLLAFQQVSTGDPVADSARIDTDIGRLQSENATLAAQSTTGGDSAAVAEAQRNLQELQSRLSDTHPDVIAAKQRLAAVQSSARGATTNPVVVAQISSNRSQIASLQAAKSMLASQSATTRAAQAKAPAIAAQIDQLDKQAEVKRDQLRMMGMRTQSASLNAKMETESKGERLTLADPPVVPDTPFKPNRKVLIAGSVAGGFGLGLALTLLLELIMRPIRGVDAVKAATGVPPLAIIPDYERKPNFVLRILERRGRKKADRKAAKALRRG
jgi:succinoglycan biosynthesis transport protein ExoP